MARLQILELPEGSDDDRPPFVLVIDEVDGELAEDISRWPEDIAKRIGARQVLCFADTIDIPANDLTLTHVQEAVDGNVVRLRVEPDLDGFTDTVMSEVAKAQAEAIHAARQQMIDELGEERATENRENIPAAEALGYRTMSLSYSLEQAQASIDRVRKLHQPVEHRGQTICSECSAYDFTGPSTDNAPVAHDQCGTLRALGGERGQS